MPDAHLGFRYYQSSPYFETKLLVVRDRRLLIGPLRLVKGNFLIQLSKKKPFPETVSKIELTLEGICISKVIRDNLLPPREKNASDTGCYRFLYIENLMADEDPLVTDEEIILNFAFKLPDRLHFCPNAETGRHNELLHDRLPPSFGNPINCGLKFNADKLIYDSRIFQNGNEFESKFAVTYFVKAVVYGRGEGVADKILFVGRKDMMVSSFHGAISPSLRSTRFTKINPQQYYDICDLSYPVSNSEFEGKSDCPVVRKKFNNVSLRTYTYDSLVMECKIPDPISVDNRSAVIPIELDFTLSGTGIKSLDTIVSLVLRQTVYLTAQCGKTIGSSGTLMSQDREGKVIVHKYPLLKDKNEQLDFLLDSPPGYNEIAALKLRARHNIYLQGSTIGMQHLCPTFHSCTIQVMYDLEVTVFVPQSTTPLLLRKFLRRNSGASAPTGNLDDATFMISTPVVMKKRRANHWCSSDEEVFKGPLDPAEVEVLPLYRDITNTGVPDYE
ncbi:hypothetical protein BABINDRAFT_162282 [Babjeviella inositovora NRRL Y-12698]|uniref:Arrestin-like N-terminal domain-containing protein n=1 Tax=Babjeviella inositovora NRRL Y-12698 TaxID=984486 RepID=A0A1E3QQK7_9ASCO|nr:uncharacterized protein BABINDRAFT_162282 [Babjeviella inositovora NRRL Y-12698]ODQ79247.1 hypothetical protein BABINDRAFT_162282 [Babjeviella inositovora NRRL Y-12698]